jgi:hypothetical protein
MYVQFALEQEPSLKRLFAMMRPKQCCGHVLKAAIHKFLHVRRTCPELAQLSQLGACFDDFCGV